jgi:hypothetical protein
MPQCLEKISLAPAFFTVCQLRQSGIRIVLISGSIRYNAGLRISCAARKGVMKNERKGEKKVNILSEHMRRNGG